MQLDISRRLYELRKKNGLSQEELAYKLGVSRQAISKWECGESYPETVNMLELSKIYNVTVDEIITGRTNEMPTDDSDGKYLFGMVKVEADGKILIPPKARQVFDINPGDELIFLGDVAKGMAIVKNQAFAEYPSEMFNKQGDDE